MKTVFVSLVLLYFAAFLPGRALGQTAAETPQGRVGQVFIIGNTVTHDSVILRQVQVYPGQILRDSDLRKYRKNLERLGYFKAGSVEVAAYDDPNNPDSVYKNVFIKVEETATSSVKLMTGLNSRYEPVVSVVWEERNFDPLRLPISMDDLMNGGAFRGDGQLFRLELIQLSLWPFRTPRFMQTGGALLPTGDFILDQLWSPEDQS